MIFINYLKTSWRHILANRLFSIISILGLAILLGMAQGYTFDQVFKFFPFYPEGYGVDLMGVYAGWIITLALLYPLCKWVAEVKRKRKDWWLSYL